MDFKKDLNFLRFLTATHYASTYDHGILTSLLKEIMLPQVKTVFSEYARDFDTGNSCNELNLYIHIPYCIEECSFCHCPHCRLSRIDELIEYEHFLTNQMREFSSFFKSITMNSVYLGGGSPSLLSKEGIQRIFESLFKYFRFNDKIQINFEAHPSSLSADKLKVLKTYGINRVSLGVQSLDKKVLAKIGRLQTEKTVFTCIDNVRKIGFPYLNIDLIAGLSSQTVGSFLNDLRKIIHLKPEIIHLTPFSSVFETLCYKKEKIDISEMTRRRHIMILEGKKILESAGYKIFGFEAYQLKKGGESYIEFSHNVHGGSILGLGIFAKTNLTGRIILESLSKNGRQLSCFHKGSIITKRYSMANFVILNLLKGLRDTSFQKVFNESLLRVFGEELGYLKNKKLITAYNGFYRYSGQRTVRGFFDYFSYSKIFFGEELLGNLRKKLKNKFIPSENYSSDKYLMTFFQDHLILGLYYNVGC